MSYLVVTSEDRFSCDVAHIKLPFVHLRQVILLEGEQIFIHVLPSHNGNNCFIIPNFHLDK